MSRASRLAFGPSLARLIRGPAFIDLSEGDQNNFNALRLFFAVLVIYSHSFIILPSDGYDLVAAATNDQTFGGNVGVKAFFVISGFLVAASWLRSKGIWDYLRKRALRIYPGFVIACLFCAFIVGALGAASIQDYYRNLNLTRLATDIVQLNKLSLPPTLVTNAVSNQVNGSIWTIKIEAECYVLIIVLAMLGFFRRRFLVVGLFAALWTTFLLMSGPMADKMSLIQRFDAHISFSTYFLAGTIFYLYRREIIYSPALVILSMGLLVVSAQVGGLIATLPIAGTYLLMCVAYSPWLRLHHVGRKVDLSYGIYLYAWPIQQLLALFVGVYLNSYTLFLAATLLSAGMAFFSWTLIEQPCLRLKRLPAGSLLQLGRRVRFGRQPSLLGKEVE